MEFEWDEVKEKKNRDKHEVSFNEATEIFYSLILRHVDKRFNYGETRYRLLGITTQSTVIMVVCSIRNKKIRIISARRANRKERELYHEYCKKTA